MKEMNSKIVKKTVRKDIDALNEFPSIPGNNTCCLMIHLNLQVGV